jgi:hypothetical protein
MELDNAQKIISMYENIVEYSRVELKLATETARAQESVSQLGRSELMEAFSKISALEEQNRLLREQRRDA